jgi:hypothetical protein
VFCTIQDVVFFGFFCLTGGTMVPVSHIQHTASLWFKPWKPRTHANIHASGKVSVMGSRTEREAWHTAKIVALMIKQLGYAVLFNLCRPNGTHTHDYLCVSEWFVFVFFFHL